MDGSVDVFEYDSIQDLERTIEVVYERQMAFRDAVTGLRDEVERFMEYRHDPVRFREAADHVSGRYGDDAAIASIAEKCANKRLDPPEEADNWDRLQEAVAAADGAGERLRETHEQLWAEFGYTDEAFEEVVMDRVPFKHFLRVWEDEPQLLFDAERYQGRHRDREDGPTLGRRLADRRRYDTDRLSRKQQADVRRGEQLDRILDEEADRGPGWMWSEDSIRETVSHSRWVDETQL